MENNIIEESYIASGFNNFAVGDTVELVGNSENIELVEHILHSKGNISKQMSAETYIVQFGELEVPISSFDLKLHSEQSSVM